MKYIYLLIPFAFLASCSVGPSYKPPLIGIPSEWKHSGKHEDENDQSKCTENWWEVFDDEKLNCLESEALENNKDLFVAWKRVDEAQEVIKIAAADLYPQLTINPVYNNTLDILEFFGGGGGFVRAHQLFYLLPANLSYQVDLWGRIKDQCDSSVYDWAAKSEDYRYVMLTLTSNLAMAYYQLRAADTQLDLLRATLKTRQKAFDINSSRYEGELTFYADVTLAAEDLSSVQGQYYEVLRQRSVLEDEIAVLIGVPASEFSLEHMPLSKSPPRIPEGVPSDILLRRPDIAEAEYKMGSQHFLVKKAYTQFFPSLSLTAAGGFESPIMKVFLRYVSRYWMLGATSNQTVFDGGRNTADLNRQIAIFEEATGEYQQQVLEAFEEVEDALTGIEYYSKQYTTAENTVEWARKSYQLYHDRYDSGLTYYIDVVDTERDLLRYQMLQNQVLGFRYIATIQLIKALGGSWSAAIDGKD